MLTRNLTQVAGSYIGTMDEYEFDTKPKSSPLIHVLDKQTDTILGTLNAGEYTDDIKVSSAENANTFDFTALKKFDLLEKRNRLLLQDKDGFFSEYLIIYAEQKRDKKFIRANAAFTDDLQKVKIIEPQTLQGASAESAAEFALAGTGYKKGKIDYAGIRTIKIDEYTNPFGLLKKIASEFDLVLRIRIGIEENKIIRYVDLTLPDDTFSGREIVFGKDMIGLRRIEDAQNIVTALLVIGPKQEDGTRQTVLVEDMGALQRWGRNGQHLIEVYEPEITAEEVTVDRLKTLGNNELKKRIDASVTYECEAAVLEHIPGKEHEKIRLDYNVRINDEGFNPAFYLEAKVIELKEQPSTQKVLGFTLGNYKEKNRLAKRVESIRQFLSDRITSVEHTVAGQAVNYFSNANGECLRFANGTQICWGWKSGTIATGTEWTITFPAQFIDNTYALFTQFHSAHASNDYVIIKSENIITTQAIIRFSYVNNIDSTATHYTQWVAIGRWK